jgi:hypothetical protein
MTLTREQMGVVLGMGLALALTLGGFALPLVWTAPWASDARVGAQRRQDKSAKRRAFS